MSSIAVVVVDLQYDFLDQSSLSPSAHWEKAFCVPSVQRLLAYARAQGWQVVHVGTMHDSTETLPFHHRIRNDQLYCEKGTRGSDFVIAVDEIDVAVFKKWYSVFESAFEASISGVDTIVWAGVATDCCIQASVFDADRRGIRNIVPFQAVSASSCDSFCASLAALGKSVASIVDLEDVMAGKGLTDPGIEVSNVNERAAEWFRAQQARLDLAGAVNLEEVLQQLEGVVPDLGSSMITGDVV